MSFSADWLALRRDADLRARNPDLAERLSQWAEGRIRPVRVLDLGAGTGANLAATSAHMAGVQHWRLVDHDPALLGKVRPPEGITVDPVVADLAAPLAPLFNPAPDLVTASAFFDLCGTVLIDRLIDRITGAGAAFYTVLSYDGHEVWAPAHPADEAVLSAFHADQHSDKGLGPALGPKATAYLETAFSAAGYSVFTGQSDWQLSRPGDADLIAALAEGSAAATVPALGQTARDWGVARTMATEVMIGHLDLLALPPD